MSANAGKTKRVLGVSGSPIRDSNIDRAVKLALAEKAKIAEALR